MRTIIFRQRASAELRAIGTLTRAKWGDALARTHVAELRERIKSLRQYPLRFLEFGPERPGLRKMRCGGHTVFYLVTDDRIEIVRIIHARMDFETRLRLSIACH